MKRSFLALVMLAFLAFASISWAQKSNVINTVHNVGGNGCGSCHAPHNGSAATGGTDQSSGTILLWDRAFSSQTFGTYDSPTMNNKSGEIGGLPIANTEPRMSSILCMSCHDGITTSNVIGPGPAAVGNPTSSFGLKNDHPVNMSHNPTNDAGLAAVTTVTSAGLKLFGTNNTVQCGSCHDVHSNANAPFLRVANTGSALCTTCHL